MCKLPVTNLRTSFFCESAVQYHQDYQKWSTALMARRKNRGNEKGQAIAKLIEMGVIHKISYGYQYGKPSSGYIIKDPDEIIQL